MAKYYYTQEIGDEGETQIVCYKLNTKKVRFVSVSDDHSNYDSPIGEWFTMGNVMTKQYIMNQEEVEHGVISIEFLGEYNTLNNPIEVLYA